MELSEKSMEFDQRLIDLLDEYSGQGIPAEEIIFSLLMHATRGLFGACKKDEQAQAIIDFNKMALYCLMTFRDETCLGCGCELERNESEQS